MRRLLWCALLALALTIGSAAPPVEAKPRRHPAVRILIVGDSVTQGAVGDWTWRYRLWQHLSGATRVNFVGPRDGVFDPVTENLDDDGYADPNFDSDHAAHWGMGFATQEYPIADLVTRYRPDIVIEMLGLNDLVFYGATPEWGAMAATAFVEDAQSADPDVKVVLGQLPQQWKAGVPEYNDLLEGLGETLQGVVVTHAPPDFSESDDVYDGLHPTETGEVKIAQSVADALAELGVKSSAYR